MGALTNKVRLYDLAKELKIDTKRLIEEVRREGVDVSVPSNQISKQLADRIRGRYLTKRISASKEALNLTYKPFGSLMSSDITSESAVIHSTINPLKPLIPTA